MSLTFLIDVMNRCPTVIPPVHEKEKLPAIWTMLERFGMIHVQ